LKTLRRNEQIRALAVRIIGNEGEQVGLMPIEKAMEMAREADTDLVEVSPKSNPPVCKLMDYGKYLYKLKKQDQRQKQKSKKTEVKGVRLGVSIGDHDLAIKKKQAIKFLGAKNLVKVVIIFKGRELMHKDLGRVKMLEFAKSLEEYADVESPPKHSGYQTIMMLAPKK